MNLFVLDTDVLSLWQHGHVQVCKRVAGYAPDSLAITIITVQEQLDGGTLAFAAPRIANK